MAKYVAELDRVFHSVADPTRRAVIERLGAAPAATTELFQRVDMALPSFMQHLAVLEHTGIVTSSKRGRVRVYELVPEPLVRGEHWMVAQRRTWEQRLDQLDAYLDALKEPKR